MPSTTFDSRARILDASALVQFTSRARILHADALTQFTARARIKAQVSGGLEVTFNVAPEIRAHLPVFFNITDAVRLYALFSSRARIQASAIARLPVDFTIDYTVPTDCVLRPTQRLHSRTAAKFYCRARIISSVPPP